jgi:U3 small nucleolar ribonucleoprotein component
LHAETIKTAKIMSIDTYRLTSMEEPTDEVLSQLMREAAEDASQTNAEATTRFFDEIKQAAAAY